MPRIAFAKLALSIVLSPPLLSALGGPALLCFATWLLHKFDISTRIIQKDALDLFVELILGDGSLQ